MSAETKEESQLSQEATAWPEWLAILDVMSRD